MAKRIVAKVDEYEKDGQVKGKYVEIGVVLNNDNGEYMLLDPTVNIAGVLQKQNMLARKNQKQPRDMVMASIFDNSQQQGGWGQPQHPNNGQPSGQPQQMPTQAQREQAQQQRQQQAQPQYNEPPMDFDDDIPF